MLDSAQGEYPSLLFGSAWEPDAARDGTQAELQHMNSV